MTRGWIHTRYQAGRWINTAEDGGILAAYDSQAAAKLAGRAEAERRETTHVVHRIDGSIVERRSPTRSAGAEPPLPGDNDADRPEPREFGTASGMW